jgi:[acyl-carrier-protein] S-malonyltransferase
VSSNVTEQPVTKASDAGDVLLRQLTSPVRWTGLVRNLAQAHPQALFVEMGPGNVLVGLVKRIAPEVSTFACGTAAEVDQLLARLS